MNGHKHLNLILALIFLPAAIVFPNQLITLSATNPNPPETNLLEALPGNPGATVEWWAAVREDLHLPGYQTTRPIVGISGLSLVPNWLAEGDQESADFGNSVASAGDVNGDGYSDVIVGAPFYDNGQNAEGAAAVYYGSASGLSLVRNWGDEGDQEDAEFGFSVSTAGDVNGDGYDDVIVGAPYYTNGQAYEGAVAVYYGSASGLSLVPNWGDEGDQEDAQFGWSVGTAGDVNGDGYDDVIIGAPFYDHGQVDEGAVAVYHGSASGLSFIPNWLDESEQEAAEFGFSVSTAGDVNGDGYADVIVGAYMYDHGQVNEGAAVVYHGSASGLSLIAAWLGEGDQENAFFGRSVGTAGDVNGDGYADIIVSAPSYDHGQDDEGAAAVYYGSASGLSLIAAWLGEGNQVDAYFGRSVGTAGDVNGDGFSDVIVGAHLYDNGQTDEGAAFVYHGSGSGLSIVPDWMGEGDQDLDWFGYSVGTAGDVNGDGYDDVIVGIINYSNGQYNEGAIVVYHGGEDLYYLYLPLVLRNH